MAQRRKQFGAPTRAKFAKGSEIRVPQQGVATQGLFRKVPVGGFEKRDPDTVMLCYGFDKSDESIGGFGPFLSGHAPRTINKKIEVASLPGRWHVVRRPQLNQRVSFLPN